MGGGEALVEAFSPPHRPGDVSSNIHDVADPASLCVSCGYRDSLDGDFCAQCMERRAVDSYLQKDEPRVQARRERWKGWAERTVSHRNLTQSPEALKERQRRHRLLTRTRPREVAHRDSDPLELADTALEHLRRVRKALRSNLGARAALDEAEELVKQLGRGPQSVPSLPKAERKLPGGLVGMHNRWHRDAGKPCNCPPGLAEELRKKPGGKAASDPATDTSANAATSNG